MNEPAGDQITEVLNDHHLHLTVADNLDSTPGKADSGSATDDADADADTDDERPVRPDREGLPPAFRMRHDAHYVDELMSRTVHDAPAPSPDRRDSRPGVEPASPAPIGPALGVIADRLESLVAHAATSRPQVTSPSLVAQSVEIEFVRVARLARAAATLQHREPPLRVDLSGRDIVEAATRAAAPVARLAGLDFDIAMDDPAFEILAEPAMVDLGIAGTVDALVDLLLSDPRRQPAARGRQPAGRVSISVQSVRVRPAIIIDVFCPTLFVSGAHAARFFDNAADDYRAAPAAGVLLAAAAHIVRAHGGRADVKRHNASGATITYVFPQTP